MQKEEAMFNLNTITRKPIIEVIYSNVADGGGMIR